MPSSELIIGVSLVIFGVILSVQDFIKKEVGCIPLLGFTSCCITSFYFKQEVCFIPFIIFIIIGVLYFAIKKAHAFGIADYIVAFSISFILPNSSWPFFIMLCGVCGSITHIITKSQKIPFIPPTLASCILVKAFF